MNVICCRAQTTKGIWIAKCVGIEPSTIAMDLEGTDGRERGEVITNCVMHESSCHCFVVNENFVPLVRIVLHTDNISCLNSIFFVEILMNRMLLIPLKTRS